jgi:hypothetical protein
MGHSTPLHTGSNDVRDTVNTVGSFGTMSFSGNSFTMTGTVLTRLGADPTAFTVTGNYGDITVKSDGYFDIALTDLTYTTTGINGYYGVTLAETGLLSIHMEPGTTKILGGTVSLAVVPIPAAGWLLGSGLVGLVGLRRKIRK